MKFNPGVAESEIKEREKNLDDLPDKIIEIHSYEFARGVICS